MFVASCVEAWIETDAPDHLAYSKGVASCVEAWIETQHAIGWSDYHSERRLLRGGVD